MLDEVLTHWGLTRDGEGWRGWTAVVVPVRGPGGEPWVVKLPDPGADAGEAAALAAWSTTPELAGRTVSLLDEHAGALLLERLDGERALIEHDRPDEIVELIAELIPLLGGVAPPPGLPSTRARIEQMADDIDSRRSSGLVPEDQVERALATLSAEQPGTRLLHGDLHPANVLRDLQDSRWVVIDPLPRIGATEFEVIPTMRNRWIDVRDDPDRLLRRRLRRLCGPGGLDSERAAALCQASAVDYLLWALPGWTPDVEGPAGMFVPSYRVMAGW